MKSSLGEGGQLAAQVAVVALLGVVLFLVTVPPSSLAAGADGFTAQEDQLTHLASLRYFIWDEWRWPLTRVAGLGGAEGTSIIFTDAIPLYAILLKTIRGVITREFNFLGAWLLSCYLFQGLAAMAAVRLWGCRRWLPVLSAALLALSLPAWIGRAVHAAGSQHSLLLLAIGLHGCVASTRRPGRLTALAFALGWVALAVNAYLFVMVFGLAMALALRLLMPERWRSISVLVAVAAGWIGAGVEMWALGFFTPHGMGWGFGHFSMNLWAPIHPVSSSLVGRWFEPLDATGGQYEGFNYLGLGLLLLLGLSVTVAVRRREVMALGRQFWPLALLAVGLTVFALSNRVYAGDRLLLALPQPPSAIAQFRATGRFFWPVAYLTIVGSVVFLARRDRRFELVLLGAAALALADATRARSSMRQVLTPPAERIVEADAWVPVLAAHRRVVVAPTFGCAGTLERRAVGELVYVASIPRTEISTFYSGRPMPEDCRVSAAKFRAGDGVDAETLVVRFDRNDPGIVHGPAGWTCAYFPAGRACSRLPQAAELLRPLGPVRLGGQGLEPGR